MRDFSTGTTPHPWNQAQARTKTSFPNICLPKRANQIGRFQAARRPALSVNAKEKTRETGAYWPMSRAGSGALHKMRAAKTVHGE